MLVEWRDPFTRSRDATGAVDGAAQRMARGVHASKAVKAGGKAATALESLKITLTAKVDTARLPRGRDYHSRGAEL
jgi:hypothetical protein